MIKFISKFPFISIVKSKYEIIVMNDNEFTSKQKEIIKFINGNLSVDNIPINKIRYVFNHTFLYDINNNEINPVYQIMKPINFGWKKKPCLEIGKPENSIQINFVKYIDIDDITKQMVMISKKGIVLYVEEYQFYGEVGIVNLDFLIKDNS